LQGVLVGMDVTLQPVLVTENPACIVSYEYQGKELSFEIEPVEFDEAGFDIAAPLFGVNYKRPKDTAREKQKKILEAPGLAAVMGPAHSFINPESPFMRQSTGTQIEVAETVRTHEIVISATEAAKRFRAECGFVPEGFISELQRLYPEGVSTRIVDDLIKARKPETETPINAKNWIIEGGAADPTGGFDEAPAAALNSKIA
jgi:hypothetical protein